jgi:CelD/BcsL family acetyltransferase involved in cellulose biosynthesis
MLILDRDREGLIELFVEEILRHARGAIGAVLREIPAETELARYLRTRSARITSRIELVGETICPRLSLTDKHRLETILKKNSLKRHSAKLRKLGQVSVEHHLDAGSIASLLREFFQQHIIRWSATPYPSLFLNPNNCKFYHEVIHALAKEGNIIFTALRLDGRPVAFHLGLASYRDFLWYKPSFDVTLAQVSPGEVMLRELLTMAASKGFDSFDFTRGDEAFKQRFSSEYRTNLSFMIHRSVIKAMVVRAERATKKIVKKWMLGGLGSLLLKSHDPKAD